MDGVMVMMGEDPDIQGWLGTDQTSGAMPFNGVLVILYLS